VALVAVRRTAAGSGRGSPFHSLGGYKLFAPMPKLPLTEDSVLIRTDFSDEAAWQSLCRELEKPSGEFQAYLTFVSDPSFDKAAIQQLIDAGIESGRSFLLIADRETIEDPEHKVMAVDLSEDPGRSFRFMPSVAWSVENNLSLANMDFFEFAEAVGEDGVFRGFA
jgi:hypothetical protein